MHTRYRQWLSTIGVRGSGDSADVAEIIEAFGTLRNLDAENYLRTCLPETDFSIPGNHERVYSAHSIAQDIYNHRFHGTLAPIAIRCIPIAGADGDEWYLHVDRGLVSWVEFGVGHGGQVHIQGRKVSVPLTAETLIQACDVTLPLERWMTAVMNGEA